MPKKAKNLQYYEGIGRRKEAVARVRLYLVGKSKSINIGELNIKEGEIYINKKPVKKENFFQYTQALRITNNENRFAISVLVRGGGNNGQLEAVNHGLARALELVDKENYRSLLKKEGLLTRDARVRERRKVGTGGKARRQKQSPKR